MQHQIISENGKKPQTAASFLWVFNMALCIAYMLHGMWKFEVGYCNPRHDGWVQGSIVMMISAVFCAWLTWRRRYSNYNSLILIMLSAQISQIVTNVSGFRADELKEEMHMTNILFAALLALLFWEERRYQNAAKAHREG